MGVSYRDRTSKYHRVSLIAPGAFAWPPGFIVVLRVVLETGAVFLLGLRWQALELSVDHQRTGTVDVNKRTVRGRGVQWAEVPVGSRIGFGSQHPEHIGF